MPDVAWQCAGEVDHIGALTGKKCPTRVELSAARAASRVAAAAALAAPAVTADDEKTASASVTVAGLTWTTASPEHAADLKWRSSSTSSGAKNPYETLLLDRSATPREVRRAYKALATRLHPDKNPGFETDAAAAFAHVGTAFQLLTDAAAREAFDAAADGGRASFNDEQSFASSGQTFGADLYARAPLVTELSEAVFANSFTHGRVWLLIFYAPWCGHCQQAVPMVSAAAEALADNDMGVDVGAINCAKYETLCGKADIREYPSYRLMAGGISGLSQVLPYANAQVADEIAAWSLETAKEWRWLMSAGNVSALTGETAWDAFLSTTPALSLVLCVDASESGPARTAKTNLLRLAASVGAQRVAARVVDCDVEDAAGSALCTRLGLPTPPFAPVLRVLRAGAKKENDVGETLFSPADVEPHVALAIAETIIRLAIRIEGEEEEEEGKKTSFDKGEKKKEEEKEEGGEGGGAPSPPTRPKLNWSGQSRPKSIGGGGGRGGSAPMAPRLG